MDATNQIGSELIAVTDIVEALDVTAHTVISADTRTCVTHGIEFLEDHLRRLYGLEEEHGLLQILLYVHPELQGEVQRLHAEHDRIRQHAHGLVQEMEHPHDVSEKSLHKIMRELRQLLHEILNHEHHETAVLLDSVNLDQGGES